MLVLLAMLLLDGIDRRLARVCRCPRDGVTLAQTDTGRVKIGAEAPDFTLESLAGPTVTLSQFRGKQNVVLVFYRGFW
jgi:cytochrome oxidase Cu insertion factor (SCO1/SenC/PrrC family)